MWESVIGRSAATLYRRLTVDQLPLLIVVSKVNSKLTVVEKSVSITELRYH